MPCLCCGLQDRAGGAAVAASLREAQPGLHQGKGGVGMYQQALCCPCPAFWNLESGL